MKRSLVVVLFLALGAAFVPTQLMNAQEAGVTTIRLATLAPAGSIIMRGMDAWNRELRRRTDRSLQFRFYPGGVQGEEVELIRKVRSGRLDAASVTSTGLGEAYRPSLVFQLPGLYRRRAQLDAARAALQPEIDRGMLDNGFRMLGWADVGNAHVFSNREIHRPDDLRPCRIWIRADDVLMPMMFEVLPGTGVSVGVPEMLGALQTHRIDTFLAPPAIAVAFQWNAHVTHYVDEPVLIVVGGTVMNESVFQTLTEPQKTALTESAEQFHALARRSADRVNQQSLEAINSRGITVVHATEEDVAAWVEIGRRLRGIMASRIADADLIERAARFGER